MIEAIHFPPDLEDAQLDEGKKDVLSCPRAGEAYRCAMPLLLGYDNIRDFIACTAHGMLIGAIEESRGSTRQKMVTPPYPPLGKIFPVRPPFLCR